MPDDSDVLGDYAGGGTVNGKPVIVLDTRGIVPNFVRALNEAIEVKMARVPGWGGVGVGSSPNVIFTKCFLSKILTRPIV
jgi:hypothetical protein